MRILTEEECKAIAMRYVLIPQFALSETNETIRDLLNTIEALRGSLKTMIEQYSNDMEYLKNENKELRKRIGHQQAIIDFGEPIQTIAIPKLAGEDIPNNAMLVDCGDHINGFTLYHKKVIDIGEIDNV